MRVDGPLRMELIDEHLGEAARILNAGEAVESKPVALCAFKNCGTSSEGDCNFQLIRAQQVSNASNLVGF